MKKSGVSIDWGGFDKAISGLLYGMSHKNELLETIGEVMVSGTLKRFQDGNAPDGTPWKPAGRGGKTLVDTAELRNSITSAITADSVLVGSNKPYASIHQEGGTIKPKKGKFLKFKGAGGKEVFVKEVNMPARPYLGLSKEDEDEIKATVADFLKQAVKG